MTTGHGVFVIIRYYFYSLLLHNTLAISLGCYLQFLPLSVADSYIEFLEFLVPRNFQSPGPSWDQVKFWLVSSVLIISQTQTLPKRTWATHSVLQEDDSGGTRGFTGFAVQQQCWSSFQCLLLHDLVDSFQFCVSQFQAPCACTIMWWV